MIRLLIYILAAFLLAVCGISALSWGYWVAMFIVFAVDIWSNSEREHR